MARFTDCRARRAQSLDELLPLALAGGNIEQQSLPVPSAAGTYRVSLAPRGAPETVVAVASIEVGPASSGEPR
jgi:hypothetical protein